MKSISLKSIKVFLLGGLLACGLVPALASATPVKFDINGHYGVSDYVFPGGDFTGSMKVDTDTGELLSFNATFPGLATFTGFSSSYGWGLPRWTITSDNGSGEYLSLTFDTPDAPCQLAFWTLCVSQPGSLVGFAGGSIWGDGVIGSNWPGLPNRFFLSGDITLAQPSTGVPEPAALGMFGAGVLLLGLFAGLRRRFD